MSERLKIIWHLPYSMIGGVETLYATLLKYMDQEKFDNIVTCHQDISEWVFQKYKGIAKIKSFRTADDLAFTIDSINPSVIMGTHGGTLYVALEKSSKDHKVIEIIHGSHIWVEHNIHMPKKWTKHLVSVSNSARDVYEKNKTSLPREHQSIGHSVIINGVDTEIFNPKRPLQRQPKVIAYMGRFLECDKHITKLINGYKLIGNHLIKLHLIGGTPEETVRLKHFSRSLKLENQVYFSPHTDSPELLYKNIDIATIRSEAEGYCLSAAEALATGTPLVCYNFGGILDHVEPGTIAVGKDQKEYVEKLKKVVSDFELRKSMRKKGLEFIMHKGNAKIMAQNYSELIERVSSGEDTSLFKEYSKSETIIDLSKEVSPPSFKESFFLKKPTNVVIPHVLHAEVYNNHKVVGVFNPHWHGIATATKGITDTHVHWNKDPNIMVSNILKHKPDKVLFSGMCPGFDVAIRSLHKQNKNIDIYIYYHGGISHYSFSSGLFGEGEKSAFSKVLNLQKEGLVKSIAVSSPGFDKVLRANGYKSDFCGNIRELEELPPQSLLPGMNIGNWNRHHDHKHTTIALGATHLLRGSIMHCLKGIPRIPGLNYACVKDYSEMSQERLFELYRQMTVNVQMSFIETFNISIMELWAAGRPVIISPSNYVLVESAPQIIKDLVPKDPTNPYELSELIAKASVNSEEIVEAQFQHLNKINTESKERWKRFFS